MACGGCNKPKPEVKSASLASLASGAIKLAKSEIGIGIASPEVIADRRGTCEACDQWNHGRCMKCGCFTYAKTRLTNERCPLGKWGDT
jgi:hypothetical protein